MNQTDIPWADIDAAIADGQMVDAVRLYRLATGSAIGPAVMLLNERKAVLGPKTEAAADALAPTQQSKLTQPVLDDDALARIRTFEDSAYCPVGGRLAAWRNRHGELCVLHRRDARSVEVNILPVSGNYAHDLHGFSLSNEDLIARLEAGGELHPADFAGTTQIAALILRQLAPTVVPEARTFWQPSRATVLALDALRFEARYAFRGDYWSLAEWQGALERAARLPELAEPLLDARAEPTPTEGFIPNTAQCNLLLHLCIAECAVDQVRLDSEHFFADLASKRLEDTPLGHRDAWSALIGLADVNHRRRNTLPPWLDRATRNGQLAGLSPPGMARFLVPRLDGCLPPGPDLDALWTFLAGAAGRGNWLLAMAPTS